MAATRFEKRAGRALKWYRKKKKIGQVKMSQKIGVSQSLISKIESGKLGVDLNLFVKILKVYGYKIKVVKL